MLAPKPPPERGIDGPLNRLAQHGAAGSEKAMHHAEDHLGLDQDSSRS
jgi:hypothetical protein